MRPVIVLAAALVPGFVGFVAAAQEPPPITKLPKLIIEEGAVYPEAALRDRVEAEVELEITITATGAVARAVVVRTSTRAEVQPDGAILADGTVANYGFDEAAMAAVKMFRFEPAEAGGEPVEVTIGYRYRFVLPPPPQPTAETAASPGIANLVGRVRERGTRRLLKGAVVTVFRLDAEEGDQGFESITGDDGRFTFFDLAPGTWKVLVEADGYFPVRTSERVVAGQITEVTYFAEKGAYSEYDVLVETDRVVKEVNRRVITAQEAYRVPGAFGDPVSVVQNLPGAARPAVGAGQFPVRGSAPADTGYLFEGIETPFVFHFGSVKSVVPAELIDSVAFIPGNFSVFYGRRTGGILDVKLKRIDPDQVHGSAQLTLLDANGYLEAPLGDTFSVAGGFRGSYVDAIIEGVVGDNVNSVDVISAPAYIDYQTLARWRPKAGHEVRLFFFGSRDELRLLFQDAQQLSLQLTSGAVQSRNTFNRVIAQYDYRPNQKISNELQIAFGVDDVSTQFFDVFEFDFLNYQWQVRDRLRVRFSENLLVDFGVDGLFRLSDVDVVAPNPNQDPANPDASDLLATSIRGFFDPQIAPYVEANWDVTDRLTLIPGVRVDTWGQAEDVTVDPRINARYIVAEGWTVKGGVGLFSQSPTPPELSEEFGNPDLAIEKSVQVSAGFEWNPVDYFKADITLFYKYLYDLAGTSNAFRTDEDGNEVPAIFDNETTGNVVGLEVYLKHDFNKNFRGWLAYTLSRSTRIDSGETETRLFDFDQTHILALVASYLFPENWELSARFRLTSGNPFTPVTGSVYLDDQDAYAAINGDRNSDRLPVFHSLDIRLDKRWVFKALTVAAFLEVLNAYNRQNAEGVTYNFDFSEQGQVSGLPVFPNLGVRIDF